jgi:hypothetical protein
VDFVRDGLRGVGAARCGNSRWRRVTEVRAAAKSVFHFDVPGSVAKSTHAGLPWLRYIRLHVPGVHFWPFDGWDLPAGRSVVTEVYPSLCNRGFARENRNEHQHDAFSVAEWMRRSDLDGTLADFLAPPLAPAEREAAHVEGWILGIQWNPARSRQMLADDHFQGSQRNRVRLHSGIASSSTGFPTRLRIDVAGSVLA